MWPQQELGRELPERALLVSWGCRAPTAAPNPAGTDPDSGTGPKSGHWDEPQQWDQPWLQDEPQTRALG